MQRNMKTFFTTALSTKSNTLNITRQIIFKQELFVFLRASKQRLANEIQSQQKLMLNYLQSKLSFITVSFLFTLFK